MEKTITLPLEDFKIIFEGFESVCNEYAGAKEIDEIYLPIYNKHIDIMSMIKEEK